MKLIKIFSFIILGWLIFMILIYYLWNFITINWIIQAIQMASELITFPLIFCAPVFLVYGIIKLVKDRKNRNYLLICTVNLISLVLIIIGWFFVP